MLISQGYQDQQRSMHENKKINYGTTGEKYGEAVGQMIDVMEVDEVLDYGSGHNMSLRKTLRPERKIRYTAYDPGVPELAELPNPHQMVVCIDVLEHIEPEYLDNVLDHLEELTKEVLFATVHTGPAGKTLPDGRNAHLTQKPAEWWLPKFMERFTLKGFNRRSSTGFEVICLAYNSGQRS